MKKVIRLIACCFLLFISCGNAFGFVFGEHKKIGDAAFTWFINSNSLARAFFSQALFNSDNTCPMIINGNCYLITPKDALLGGISYGDLTGMLADHAYDPIELFREITKMDTTKWILTAPEQQAIATSKGDSLVEVLLLHHYAIEQGKKAASDIRLQLIQKDYAELATVDSSHFYRLGERTIPDQLREGAEQYLHNLLKGNSSLGYFDAHFANYNLDANGNVVFKFNYHLLDTLFRRMHGLNAVSKYAVLHTIALDMIDVAASTVDTVTHKVSNDGKFTVFLALLFNACADHYLQDAFAAGHLAVARSAPRAWKNKGTHDYYNRVGLSVYNENGQTWFSHGDGFLDDTSVDFQRAVAANIASIGELWNRFNTDTMAKGKGRNIVTQLSGQSTDNIIDYFWNNYAAMKMIPHPLDPSIVKFTNSRNGNYAAVTGSYSGDNKQVQAGAYYGIWGFDLVQPKRPVKWRESNIWISVANFGASYNGTANSLALTVSALEANFYNLITIGAGSVYYDMYDFTRSRLINRFYYSPYAGLEFKPVWSGIFPSLRYTYQVNSEQKGFFSLHLRYYFK